MVLTKILRGVIPRSARRKVQNWILRRRIKSHERRIVIGAGGTSEPGWIPTQAHQLDVTNAVSWACYFEPSSVDALLAEHVWEHLTLDQAKQAAAHCYRHLKPGGYIRVAVPD